MPKAIKSRGLAVEFLEPMKCRPVTALPDGPEWTYELKFDGYRCEALKSGPSVNLLSRHNKPLASKFPEIVAAVAALPIGSAILDGEVVMLDEAGRPSFNLLQGRARADTDAFFYVFDILALDGKQLLQTPLDKRRAILRDLLAGSVDPIRLSSELDGAAKAVTSAVAAMGLEGVVAKRRASLYEPGERSGAWCKFRTNKTQEFVIAGYTTGSKGFDSLLVGYFEKKRLIYCSKVRAGFVPHTRTSIFREMQTVKKTDACPFANLPEQKGSRWGDSITASKMKECVWLEPRLVCQVAFVEWTPGGRLRHSTFSGMRTESVAADVVRET